MYLPTLLYVLFVLCFRACHCQVVDVPNCERPLYTSQELEELPIFISLISAFILGGTQTADPVVIDFSFSCLAQGPTQGLYRATSVIVDFRATPDATAIIRRRFQLMCFDGEWRQPHTDSFEDVTDLNLLPPTRFDCTSCHVSASIDNRHHCAACDASCSNTGLGRCSNVAGDECCSVFHNGTCTAQCPTNFIATANTNYECECTLDCGIIKVVNERCSGCDILPFVDVLAILRGIFESNDVTTEEILPLVDILNEILDPNSVYRADLSMNTGLFMHTVEDLALALANTQAGSDNKVTISRDYIVISALNFVVSGIQEFPNITFPDRSDLTNFTNSANAVASIMIPSDILETRAAGRADVPVANILFDNLHQVFANDSLGSLILSSKVAVQEAEDMLPTPLTISFEIIRDEFQLEAICVFWNFSDPVGDGGWLSEGLETVFDGNTSTVSCTSSHLTTFAVLVDIPVVVIEGIASPGNMSLSIITYVGLAISISILTITIIYLITYRKQLFQSVHLFVHFNLALCLLLANIVFAAGVETARSNTGVCTFVAALLHYFYLSSFCWMLCEGIILYLMLVVAFSTLSKKWWLFLLMGWVPALIIVIVTVGPTSDFYTYGENFCWLSVSRHLIWTLVAPICLIVLINVFVFVAVLAKVYIIKHKLLQSNATADDGKHIDIAIALIKASVIILAFLGLTWVFGLLAVIKNTVVFACLFCVFNSLQGVVIFFFYVIRSDRVWDKIVAKCKTKTYTINEAYNTSTGDDNTDTNTGIDIGTNISAVNPSTTADNPGTSIEHPDTSATSIEHPDTSATSIEHPDTSATNPSTGGYTVISVADYKKDSGAANAQKASNKKSAPLV